MSLCSHSGTGTIYNYMLSTRKHYPDCLTLIMSDLVWCGWRSVYIFGVCSGNEVYIIYWKILSFIKAKWSHNYILVLKAPTHDAQMVVHNSFYSYTTHTALPMWPFKSHYQQYLVCWDVLCYKMVLYLKCYKLFWKTFSWWMLRLQIWQTNRDQY